MRCPFCGHDEDKVIDSRPADDGAAIRRRRECINCGNRFTTYEKIENLPLMVIKKDGSRQPFNRDKLISGIMKSCEKRPVSTEQIESLVDAIESRYQNSLKREVQSREIGEQVMEGLKQIDEVAYVRFASVYRQFKDVSSFLHELNEILGKQEEIR
ncbi:MAG: transcriptional repressor NrdR [Clostridiaceae bacterium]|jgi:transcriptional repressor NrdR|nr:transcriptional regulator NrdR [Clostridiales bacterium]MDD2440601.1 transcriptional regulator NrdR [Eubacteriales bacterium]MDD4138903.1 transcriptional regulator NrdR [Eubacteriales bacterium]MDD4743022.1 transcriptional regulator NrdR [Eubacteriales bacterium]NLB43977.1 transcriptional repressor NrdR [Clostridiaceae bacterium]